MKALDYLTILFWPAMLILLGIKGVHGLLLKIEYYDLLAAYVKYVVFHKWNKVENVKFLQRWVDTHGSNNIKTKITNKIIKLNSWHTHY